MRHATPPHAALSALAGRVPGSQYYMPPPSMPAQYYQPAVQHHQPIGQYALMQGQPPQLAVPYGYAPPASRPQANTTLGRLLDAWMPERRTRLP